MLLGLLVFLSFRGARQGAHTRSNQALPEPEAPDPRTEVSAPMRSKPVDRHNPVHPAPPGAEDLMPRPEAVPPKDPDGPVRDWRDFSDDERAAVSGMELDLADIGDVIERLESGAEIEGVRGTPVTPDEQKQMRAAIDAFAAVYEDAYEQAYGNVTTVIEMSAAVRTGRATFDRRVREIYGLSDEQFYKLFPYRREGL